MPHLQVISTPCFLDIYLLLSIVQYLHIGDGHICKEHNYKFVKSSTFGLDLKVYKYVAVHPM